MDLSSKRSQDEATIMQRQLYRAGQTPPAPKAAASASGSTLPKPLSVPAGVPTRSAGTKGITAASDKPSKGKRLLLMLLLLGVGYYLLYGTPTQRKRVLLGLGVVAWLLMLGSISYYLCLPNLEEMARARRAIMEDPNLTWEQKREKIREMDSKLTPDEGRQVFQIDFKKVAHKKNAEMQKFLKMSPEEQAAYVKKQEEERKQLKEQFRQQGGFVAGPPPPSAIRTLPPPSPPLTGPPSVMATGGGGGAGKGGRGSVILGPGAGKVVGEGGAVQFFGPLGGGSGKGPINPGQIQKTKLDYFSPETRAGMSYQRGLGGK